MPLYFPIKAKVNPSFANAKLHLFRNTDNKSQKDYLTLTLLNVDIKTLVVFFRKFADKSLR